MGTRYQSECEIQQEEEKKALATLDTFTLYRHPLLDGKVVEGIDKCAEELAVDKELGLPKQAENTAKIALSNDIDQLTNSRDYIQVNAQTVEKLFEIPRLRKMCIISNVKEAISVTLNTMKWQLLWFFATVIPAFYSVRLWQWCNHQTTGSGAAIGVGLLALILSGATIASWVTSVISACTRRYCYSFAKVHVQMDELKHIKSKIPYGAKLKVLEAKKTAIFEDFIMAHPKFSVEQKEIHMQFNVDPAILGITKDNRMFMIVYWDVKHDIERVVKNIEHFKKFKLE